MGKIKIIIESIDDKAKLNIQGAGNYMEISLALTQLEIAKASLLSDFAKVTNFNKNGFTKDA